MRLKKLLLILSAIAIIAVGTGMLNKNDKISNDEFNRMIKATNSGFVLKPNEDEKDNKIEVRDEYKVYDNLHKMANTKVVADAVWGKLDIEEGRVNKLILEVMNSEYEDKEKLLSILRNWKNGDFTHCVEEHNYFWVKLNGNVGQATALK